MATLDVGTIEDSFVIHFGGEFARINAYTLATTLIKLADAAKAANAILNPGYEIEVVVEALGGGSFKAKIRTIYRSVDNLFSRENLRAIVLSVIASFIYEHTLAPAPNVIVNVGEHEVVIQQDDTRVVIPREIHESMKEVEISPRFRASIGEAVQAVEADPQIESFGVSKNLDDLHPDVEIPRSDLARLPAFIDGDDSGIRELIETTDLRILRAILERSRRRWQFVWNGIKIPAPVTDDRFYADFFAHKITIAPGDSLRVRLLIHQRRAADTGVFLNESYEVIEVLQHIPRGPQTRLPAHE